VASNLLPARESLALAGKFLVAIDQSSRSRKLSLSSLLPLLQDTPEIEPCRISRAAVDRLPSSSLKLETRKPLGHLDHAFAARSVVGPRVKKIAGLAIAGANGTPLTPEECVLPAFTSGPQPNVYPAFAGRHILIGMPNDCSEGA